MPASTAFASVVTNAVDDKKFTEVKDTIDIPVGQSQQL